MTPCKITSVADLSAIYGDPHPLALKKVSPIITPLYRQFIEACRFIILSTVGPEGTDASPRGDDGPVVRLIDAKTLWLPDWKGNNKIDSLRNIVVDGRLSLMFMVPGSDIVVRVNGKGSVTADDAVTGQFEQKGKHPRSVIIITVEEIYYQCAKALMRSGLWRMGDESSKVPTSGQFLKEQDQEFDGESWDKGYAEFAKPNLW